ncbi:MAG: hypothetical protein KDD53_04220, partial [Bdellovibrionales bacterium]|nr:hypothetical protein [Bdellovibrionales bacterium]
MIVERLRARCFIHTVFAVALLAGNVASPDNCIAQSDISMKVAAPQGVAALPDPADTGDIGVRIDSSNAQLYKKIFLAPIYDLVRSGSLAIDAASQLKYSLHGDDDWIEQSKKLAERGLKLDKQGALSADFPMVRGFLFGTSTALLREFEEANTKNQEKGEEEKSLIQDDKLAYKLLWNLQSQLTSLGLIQMNFAMIWIENNRLARQASGNFARVYPSVLDSGYSAEQFFREKIVFEFP